MSRLGTATVALILGIAFASSAVGASSPSISATSIAGAKLGLGAAAYKQLLGKPVHLDVPPTGFEQPENYTRLVFPKRKMYVYFKDEVDKSVQLTTWNKTFKTAAGVGPCSTVTQLKKAYGSKLKPSKFNTQGGVTYVYTMGNLLFATADLTTVTAVGLYNSKAPDANRNGGSLAFAGFVIQPPDQRSCS